MAWTRDHKQHTRKRILDSAAALFTQKGFDSVGINDVMQHAGLTRGAFYAHFSSKAALYAEAIPHAARTAQAALVQRATEAGDRRAMVDNYLSLSHRQGDPVACPLAFLTTDVSSREPEVRAAYTQVFKGFINQFSKSEKQRQAAIRNTVLMIGGLALARAIDDEALAEELLHACRASVN